jgi:hypothetical protein
MSSIENIHPNLKLLSHSSAVKLHRCPRRFELYKLMITQAQAQEEGDEHLNFGSIVGLGTQEYLLHGDYNKTIMKMFMKWEEILDDDKGEKAKKTFWHAIHAIDKFVGIRTGPLSNYTVATFDNKPAIELGFSIDCGSGFYYRGFVDALLIDKRKNELIVYEGKTTTFSSLDEAMYKHSGQSLGYPLIVDSIARRLGCELGSSYKVLYNVYKSKVYEWEIMPFIKNRTDRARWIKQLLVDIGHIVEYALENNFPMHGESCFEFFRQCPYFGICELPSVHLIGPLEKVPVKVEDMEKYQFHFSLHQLVEDQLAATGG